MQRREVRKGEVIFREGSYPRGIYILRKGKVKIYQTNRDGKDQIIYIYRKGEAFGYRPLLCDCTHPVTATAMEDCVISFISKRIFMEVLNRSIELCKRLLVNLSHEFSVWVNTVSVFAQHPVRARVALALLILNAKYRSEKNPDKAVTIALSREQLANYVGTAIETLVRILKDFKIRKIILSKGRRITILKPKELEVIADLY